MGNDLRPLSPYYLGDLEFYDAKDSLEMRNVPGGLLRRIHLFEIHDQPWLPHSLRDAVTDILQWILNLTKVYASVEPRLRAALKCSRASQVVDLCSGAGGPWLWMQDRLAAQKTPVNVWLTDKYPNKSTLRTIQKRTRQRLQYHLPPVEATRIPSDLQGFRTLFNAFHHFPPDQARALVRQAVEQREGIAIFEVPRRSIVTLVGCLIFAFGALLAVPLMWPLRWSRVFWTYVIPLAPLILCFDGLVSCLRAYSLAELSEMAQIHPAQGYLWEFGEERRGIFSLKVTFLVGFPESEPTSTMVIGNSNPLPDACSSHSVGREEGFQADPSILLAGERHLEEHLRRDAAQRAAADNP